MLEFLKLKAPVETPVRKRRAPRTGIAHGETTAQVFEYLKTVQGRTVTTPQIAAAIGADAGNIGYHLRRLMDSGAITRFGSFTRYSYRVNRQNVKPRAYRKRTVAAPTKKQGLPGQNQLARERAVLRYIANHEQEFISQAEISKSIGVHQTTVSYTIRELIRRKVLSRDHNRQGVGSRYTILVGEGAYIDTTPKHVPTNPVPVRKPSKGTDYEEQLIREFLTYWKNRKG